MKRPLYGLLFALLCLSAKAQLAVQNTATPAELVQEVLLGEGVEADNISFNNGPPTAVRTQIGTFNGGAPYIGIANGIILATGRVEVAMGPNDLPTAFLPVPASEQVNNDPDLSFLVGNTALRDVAALEFDFTARGDTLRFRYVFASEEYNDHTCSPYNDVFGFFISGPGIVGSPNFSNNAKNVALVPGTNVPVAINTVNQGFAGMYGSNTVCNAASANWQANSVYFVNNAGNPDPGTTQFDGFTVPFLIEVPVICGETYHIKIAIADAVDDKNDSAVFIEAGSFSSEVLLDASLVVNDPDGEEDLALEGCSTYSLTVSRSNPTQAKTIYLRTTGLPNAANVLQGLPASITFNAGETAKTIDFATANDGLYQGDRQWQLALLHPNACGVDTARFYLDARITDRPPLEISFPETLFVPCHQSVAVQVTAEGGNPPYTIQWNQSGVEGFAPQVATDTDQVLSATVTDACQLNTIPITVVLEAEVHPELNVVLPVSVPFDCITPVEVAPQVSGGSGDLEYAWKLNGSVLSAEEVLSAILPFAGTLTLDVTDRCAAPKSAATEAVLLANPIQVSIGNDRVGTCLNEELFVPEVTGGFGDLSYLWRLNQNELSAAPIFTFQPETTVRVSLTVNDQCGQSNSDTLFLFVYDAPLVVSLPADTVVCRGQRLQLNPVVQGAMGATSFHWPVTGGTLPNFVLIPQQNNTFTVQVTDACQRTTSASTRVRVSDVHADFAFDYDYPEMPIFNLSTEHCLYFWQFPDGSTSALFAPYFTPPEVTSSAVALTVTDVHGCEASAVRFYDPPMSLFIPTAFTPDGDGLNDVFYAVGVHVKSFHIWIFDRWGTLVYESTDINAGWNGEGTKRSDYLAGDNIFAYRYMATSWSGEVREGKGSLTLLR